MTNASLLNHSIKSCKTPILTSLLATIMALSLSACGGGSESSSDTPNSNKKTPDPIPTPVQNAKYLQDFISDGKGKFSMYVNSNGTAKVGEPVGFITQSLLNEEVDYYDWQITSGNAESAQISGSRQPAASITFNSPGTYTIKVDIKQRNALNQLETISQMQYQISVSDTAGSVAALRGDRAVASGGQTSIYFDTGKPLTSDDYVIEQLSGPDASISKDPNSALTKINFPKVDQDTKLVFNAYLKNNPDVKDTAFIILKAVNDSTQPYFCNSPTSGEFCLSTSALNHHYAYNQDSATADVLPECVMSYEINSDGFCTLAYLPFIGQVTTDPDIKDIMDRVVVTHDWMAKNFEKFLKVYDTNDDFKNLLRSTTAIVISDNIKPSFFWGGTGAMYLSADYLWMTPEERDTLSHSIDYRSGFTRQFDYFFDFDYEKNNKSVMFNNDYYVPYDTRKSRNLQTIAMPLASLLYHELAHANDYFSKSELDKTENYDVKKLNRIAPHNLIVPKNTPSYQLSTTYPLSSDIMKGLANVWYGGVPATSTQLSYSANTVANEFFTDIATDDYGFYVPEEDLAMTFEEAMMLTRFGVNRYVMVMDSTDKTPRVVEGQKNRVTDPSIYNKANFVVSKILPEAQLDVTQTLSRYEVKSLCPGTTYFSYYDLDCSNSQVPKATKYRMPISSIKTDELGRPLGAPRHQTPRNVFSVK